MNHESKGQGDWEVDVIVIEMNLKEWGYHYGGADDNRKITGNKIKEDKNDKGKDGNWEVGLVGH